eukprot:TRINITY_DN10004_c0_g1_i1.p1 TRINITY_DN10004_c0_g1~~TRINITY_DN10004_c0_g1_i1.p1  ORF type:complete len:162 (+),score=46.57 TRINITY_DN10004_c0_g1_i1:84-569(+)
MCIRDSIQPDAVECMNQKDEHPWQHMIKAGADPSYCESNTDDQMILNIEFREKVKIFSMSFKAVEGHEDAAPLNVRIYANRRLAFLDVDDHKPEAELELTAEQVADGQEVKLSFVRFQSISGLTIFIETNQSDAEHTMINQIRMLGMPIEGFDMNNFKKVG